MAYRIRREHKSSPVDEAHLLTGVERLLLWMEQHRWSVLLGALAAILAVGTVGGVLWYEARQNEAAAELYRQASQLMHDRPVDDPQKAQANLKQAIALYRRLVEEYPRSPSGPLALFQLGNALVESQDVKGAIEAYNQYVARYGANKMMLGLVYQRLAYAHLLNGDREAAAKAFLTVVELPGTVNKDHALYELGRLEESRGHPEGAMAHYQNLVRAFPNSPLASEATIRMKALEAKKTPEAQEKPSAPLPPPSSPPLATQ